MSGATPASATPGEEFASDDGAAFGEPGVLATDGGTVQCHLTRSSAQWLVGLVQDSPRC